MEDKTSLVQFLVKTEEPFDLFWTVAEVYVDAREARRVFKVNELIPVRHTSTGTIFQLQIASIAPTDIPHEFKIIAAAAVLVTKDVEPENTTGHWELA